MMPRTLRATAVLLASLLWAGTASAHSDDYLDTVQAPHGGQLRMAGAHHLELVLAPSDAPPAQRPVRVYLTDHAGAAQPTAGAQGSVTFLSGKRKTTIALKPGGDNVLHGTGSYMLTPPLKAVVSVTLPGQAPLQARFTPLAKPQSSQPAEHTGHRGH